MAFFEPHPPLLVFGDLSLMVFVAVLWFFWLGAALGSYLNVLVYRMPLGLDTIAPDSRCPKCQTRIRWHDNVPILGWLMLRGKCRACHQPISPRYPIVEAVVGSLFVLLLAAEVLTGGANLPMRVPGGTVDAPMIAHLLHRELLGIYACHALLIWFVVGIVLFALDGHRVPRNYAIAALLFVLVPPMIWPWLQPVPAWLAAGEAGVMGVAMKLALGVGTGLVGGGILSLAGDKRQSVARPALLLLGTLIGGALGCHAALVWFSIASGAWMLHLLVCLIWKRNDSQSLVLVAAIGLLALVVGWSGFCEWLPPPDLRADARGAWPLALATVFAVFAVAGGRYVDRRLYSRDGGQAAPLNTHRD